MGMLKFPLDFNSLPVPQHQATYPTEAGHVASASEAARKMVFAGIAPIQTNASLGAKSLLCVYLSERPISIGFQNSFLRD